MSKFKKISGDDKSSTFKHADGHTMIVAHNSLSPGMAKSIKALPFAAPDAADAGEQGAAQEPIKMYQGSTQENMAALQKSANAIQQPAPPSNAISQPSTGVTVPQAVQAGQDAAKAKYPNHEPAPPTDEETAYKALLDQKMPQYAKGGEIKQSNPKLEQSKLQPPGCPHCGGKPAMAMADAGEVGKDGVPVPAPYNPADSGPEATTGYNPANPGSQQLDISPVADNDPDLKSTPEAATVPAPAAATPPLTDDEGSAVQGSSEATPSDVAGAPSAPAASPDASAQPPQSAPTAATISHANPIQANKAAYDQEDAAFRHDLNNGHITPETAHSLFAKKDTLGKIGSIFGLLLSGVGSGLTGQPNMAAAMMQKQIDNDLEAQKQSKDNAMNFLRINQQNELNKANVGKVGAETAATKADTAIKNATLAQIQTTREAFHELATSPEAQTPQGQQMLGVLYPQVEAQLNNVKDKAAAMHAYIGMFSGATNPGTMDEQTFKNTNNALKASGNPMMVAKAQDNEAKHIAGVPGLADRPIPQQNRDQVQAMNVLDAKGKDVLNYINNNTTSGVLPTAARAVAAQKMAELLGYYNSSTQPGAALTEGRLKWYDDQLKEHPTDIISKLTGNTQKLQEVVNSNSQRKDQLLGSLGFPSNQAPTSGATKTIGRDTWAKSPDGKWRKVQ